MSSQSKQRGETNPSVADLDTKVASNQPYTVSISSSNPTLTSSTSDTTIPSRSGALNTAVNGWGIKKYNTNKVLASTYSAITTANQTFYTSTTPEVATISFPIGISTAANLPAAEYSTNITVTATQN